MDPILDRVVIINEKTKYEVVDGIVFIIFNNEHKIQKIFRRLGKNIPHQSRLEFDEYSSFVFLQIDGIKSIRQIGVKLQEEYGEDAEPLYERLLVFLEYLQHTKKFIDIKK